jgi:hypothetical protein
VKYWKLGKQVIVMTLAAGSLFAPVGISQAQVTPVVATPATLAAKARAAGATHINVRQRSDGEILLHGRLEGRKFVIDIPPGWQGPSAEFALLHVYRTVADPSEGFGQSTH